MKYNLKYNIHDLIFSGISILIVVLFILISYLFLPKSIGNEIVVIRYNNQIVKTMPLDIDDDFIMRKSEGYIDLYGDELIVSIRNSKVYISKEDSPFHYCSYLGEISNVGSSLICVPNCVRVTIENYENDSSNNDVDLIPGV